MISCDNSSMGMRTSLLNVGMWASGQATTSLVPKGLALWVLFLTVPVALPGPMAVGVSVFGSTMCEGAGVVMSMGESAWGELNSNWGGVNKKDSPATSDATVLSSRSFSVALLEEDVPSQDLSVSLLSDPDGTSGMAHHGVGRKGCLKGAFLVLPASLLAVVVIVGATAGSSMALSEMFSANLSLSLSMLSSFSGTLMAFALLYSFKRSTLTTLVPLFFSCFPQEGSGAILRRVSLLVGPVHMIQGHDQ